MTSQGLKFVGQFDPASITTLLCDADDNLFPSEKPAFDASAEVISRFLARFGVPAPFTAEELRKQAVGKNFRSIALDLAVLSEVPMEQTLANGRGAAVVASERDVAAGRALCADELERWVREEREQVTAHLAATLKPDPEVLGPLQTLASRYALAAVSSSATKRLDACFTATGLHPLIPAALRFSAEDSLPVPTSKPNPAVYLHAGQVMEINAGHGLAIEDSVPGVKSAVEAGYLTVGNAMFVPAAERPRRTAELIDAGAVAITDSWRALADALMLSPVTGGGSRI
ncbi:HAD family hydrolase [Candidatus Mycobacterium methanotrophicum]|uniref:HAD hydrolase-like protein n=1 Tax=Candidatus Mycobacterium methanotrophicum TaxID=2943498 RepID=A0ABY4QSM2_9MYCO|nr:HAD family hydrolase [Candidatus Mycobacterium methanotrophicum]UQX12966.1 HAD hydrolase-like protein [Candidatus Mycobacterium methanotrophicum]